MYQLTLMTTPPCDAATLERALAAAESVLASRDVALHQLNDGYHRGENIASVVREAEDAARNAVDVAGQGGGALALGLRYEDGPPEYFIHGPARSTPVMREECN